MSTENNTPVPSDEAYVDLESLESEAEPVKKQEAAPAEPVKKQEAAPAENTDPEDAPTEDAEQEAEAESEEDAETKPEEPAKKPKKTASDRIKELNRKLAESERRERAVIEGYEARLERLEKGLPAEKTDDTKKTERVAPDPDDLDKYPLGRLDDRYIEDKIAYVASLQVDEALGSALQRQQESDMHAEAERIASEAKTKIETISTKGVELFDDFVEVAVERAMEMKYPLEEPTFHAVAEADHGAEILYNLANDLAEAERVAKLTPYQQVKYVMDKNAEIAASKTKVRLPKAGDPPKNLPRGTNARYSVAGDGDYDEAFAKEFLTK
jgi:hypothetical protein